jgi:hypothetical protein
VLLLVIFLLNTTILLPYRKPNNLGSTKPNCPTHLKETLFTPRFLSPHKRHRHAGHLPPAHTPLPFLLISAALPPLPRNPLAAPSSGSAAYNARCPTHGPNGCLGASEVAYETKRIRSASRLSAYVDGANFVGQIVLL